MRDASRWFSFHSGHALVPCSFVVVALLVAGCTTRQLASRTTELGPSITKIEEEEIFMNLSRFIDSCVKQTGDQACRGVVPNQFVLGGGQAQVSNQQQGPNLTTNFMGQVVKALTFQDQNQWTENWSITPVTDFADIERLRLLYTYAVTRKSDDPKAARAFANEYMSTLVKAIDPTARMPRLMTQLDTETTKLCLAYLPLVLPGTPSQSKSGCPDWKWGEEVTANEWVHRLPHSKWVYWDPKAPPPDAPRRAGKYGDHVLYVNDSALQDFMIWILGATPNTSANAGKGGGAGKPSVAETAMQQ